MSGRPASAGLTAGAAQAIAKVSAARAAAFEILRLEGEGKGHSDELLHGARTASLSAEDRNLATALVMGVLRWQIALDAQIAGLLKRPGQRLAEPVAIGLRMGAFQLLHMDRIPDHAALSESVELCKAAGEEHAAGMVNAVLRRVAAGRAVAVAVPTSQNRDVGHPARSGETTAEFAERLGHPAWLVERWVGAYGRAAAMAICEYGQREPGRGGLFAADAELAAADAVVMDDGSRLVAEIAAAAMPVVEGRAARVWDCCAAPGGKTLVLAKRLGGADILASDVSARRMAQMTARLRRYEYAARVKTAVMDAVEESGDGKERFDLILCDVPCSGTGTLARNPEIRHRLKREEFARQAARQSAILRGALGRLAPGGRLVYATCSLEAEENERVVEAVVAETGMRRVPVGPMIERLVEAGVLRGEVGAMLKETAVRDGALRTLPGVHGCDGFFAVVLERG
ncbi:MAG: transcription antitermination factor NusB [Acidobacteriaceae bacterium]